MKSIKKISVFLLVLVFTFLIIPEQNTFGNEYFNKNTEIPQQQQVQAAFSLDEDNPQKYIIIMTNNISPANLDSYVEKIHDIYGNTYEDDPVHVAIGICGPFLLYQTVEEMKEIVDIGFELALKYNMPIYFQADDMGYWANHPNIVNGTETEFVNNTDWHERRSFASGDYAKYWFNWGSWHYADKVPALGIPGFQSWIQSQLREGVIMPILTNMEMLKTIGKEYLFAGISIGWETNVCDARKYPLGEEAVNIETGQKLTITQADRVIPFYTSLAMIAPHISDAAKLAAEKLPDGITVKDEGTNTVSNADAVIMYHAFRVVQQYSEGLAKIAALTQLRQESYQIPRTKIFTHFIATDSLHEDSKYIISSKSTPAAPPIFSAVNPYSTPGFTLGVETAPYNMPVIKARIKAEDSTRRFFSSTEQYASPSIRESYESTMATFNLLTGLHNNMEGLLLPFYGFDTQDASNIFYMPKDFSDGFVRAIYQSKHNGFAN